MAYLSLLKYGLNGPTLCHTKMPFSGLWDEGFNCDRLQRFIAGYQPPIKPLNGTYAPSPRRLATKSSVSGRKPAPGQSKSGAERKKVLALAQARKVDVTRWDRSARFAARSLACFKFRFVSSPPVAMLLAVFDPRVAL